MSGPSETSNPVIFGVTPSATFLPASASGRTRSVKPDLETLALFGPEAALASPSVPLANSAATTTTATSGPSGSSSSASASLTLSLVSRLSRRFATAGSTLFVATWKEKATPLGRPYSAHVASVPRTNANASTSWPSPRAADTVNTNETPEQWAAREVIAKANNPNLGGLHKPLGIVAKLATPASWTTPNGDDANNATRASGSYQSLTRVANAVPQASWVSPAARDWKDTTGMSATGTNPDGSERTRLDTLPRQASLAAWPPPQAHDSSPRGSGQKAKHGTTHGCADLNADAQALGPTSDGSTAATASGVRFRLNVRFSLWLQSIPPDAWVCCAERAIQSLRKRPRRSSKPTSTTRPSDE